jgi:hypothetical protein
LTLGEFVEWVEENKHVSWAILEEGENHPEGIVFRNPLLPWYQKDEGNMTFVSKWKFKELSSDGLTQAINQGLQVDYITRITGYMTTVSSWNKGKLGELKDRHRGMEGTPSGIVT